jgi:hypothetical protein
VPDNEEVLIVLLPGMDGTGMLFKTFVGLLPYGINAKIVPYPTDRHMSYAELAELVIGALPRSTPYVIIAESYSGPVACILAAHPVGDLQGVVFVSSFVAFSLRTYRPMDCEDGTDCPFSWPSTGLDSPMVGDGFCHPA